MSTETESQWDNYQPGDFNLPWLACLDLFRSHGLMLWGTPAYEDTAHNARFPRKAAPDPFHPQNDEDFIHRLDVDWAQPHLNRRLGFFQETAFLHLALDRYLRHVMIKAIPTGSKELQIIRELSSHPLRADARNHTIPVLHFISGVSMDFVVQAWWGEHWAWPPFDCAPSRFEMARQLLEGLQFMHDHGIAHGDIHPRNIVWNHSDKRPREVWEPAGLVKPPFHSLFDFRMAYIDFGAAKKFTADLRLFASNCRPPSKWAAPEQFLDKPYDVCAADVFMLGKVLQGELAEGRQWYNISDDDTGYSKYDHLYSPINPSYKEGRYSDLGRAV
ncbi:kinase-like domain-containing protein [Favolaschia claudopus]|uniref:Kinase-like domain-containing protein n=1 Tax=Favolaschia claudopus TaxID=2862362 RepID=A0AAW0D807_9AGAR